MSIYRRYVKELKTDTGRYQRVLLSLVHKMRGKYIANVDDIRPQFRTDDNVFLSQNAVFQSSLVRANGIAASATIDNLDRQPLDTVSGFKEEARPWLGDRDSSARHYIGRHK